MISIYLLANWNFSSSYRDYLDQTESNRSALLVQELADTYASLNTDGVSFIDPGPGAAIGDAGDNGKFGTPPLCSINGTLPYMPNGLLDSLEEVIDLYNRRDVDEVIPEVNENVNNGRNIGNLGLTSGEIDNLIAFLQTLSEGYR